jgi:small glutamine-rich tetratricopeptide repeat-containing protein alpha
LIIIDTSPDECDFQNSNDCDAQHPHSHAHTMSLTTKQRLALAICDFLSTSAGDGTLAADDRESVDIATGLIAECFRVDPADKAAVAEAVGDQSLVGIYAVYEKLRATTPAKPAAGKSEEQASSSSPQQSASAPPTDAQIAEAESLKSRGNAAMAAKDYPLAIQLYSSALELRPNCAVYLSNRAAAHSASRDHVAARADADAAVAADPAYTKGWSRLGLARFALGDARGAMEAYSRGIEAEGNGGSEVMRKGFETAKRRVDELDGEAAGGGAAARSASPPAAGGDAGGFAGLASLLGGGGGAGGAGGGGGGGGGLDSFAGLMQNPMFASMAQNLMSNPDMMANLMSNPRLREMADQFGSGGGMPDLASLMSDPNVAEMAKMFGGGGGAPGTGPK